MDAETLAALGDWRDSALFDATDRLVLELSEALTLENRVDDSLHTRLEAHFSREALVRLAMTIALAGMVNRIHATFRTPLEQGGDGAES